MFRPDALGFNVSVISIDGGLNDQTMPGDEVCTLHVYMSKRRLTLSCSLVFFFTLGKSGQPIHNRNRISNAQHILHNAWNCSDNQ